MSKNSFVGIPFVMLGLLAFVSACNKKLMNVLVENTDGNVELTYLGSQTPENLLQEIRFYPNGDTLSVTHMKKGVVHGVMSQYQPGNIFKEQTTFENGAATGLFKQFDMDGVLVFEGELVNGQKNGVWTTWYDEVQMQEQRTYINDQPNGKWIYWYIDGSLKREETYEFGKLIEEKNFD